VLFPEIITEPGNILEGKNTISRESGVFRSLLTFYKTYGCDFSDDLLEHLK